MNKTEKLRERIDKILETNITFHSVRQGYGVFSRTEILTACKEEGLKFCIMSENGTMVSQYEEIEL